MKIYFNGRYVVNISIVLLFLRIELNVSYFVLEFWGEVIKIFLYVEIYRKSYWNFLSILNFYLNMKIFIRYGENILFWF